MKDKIVEFRVGARSSDIQEIERITKSTGFFEAVEDEIPSAIEELKKSLKKNADKGGTDYLFAEVDGQVRAFISYGKIPCSDSAWEIYWLAVDNSIRGLGLGKRIIKKAISLLKERACRKVFLKTSARKQYIPTHEFYLKSGFAVEARLRDYYMVGDDCLIFSKELD